jgi:hypothetical protein
MPALVHHAGVATLVNLCFLVAALACSFGLPRWLAGNGGGGHGQDADREPGRQQAGRESAASVRDR